jgi:hypothetical protein
MSLSLHQTPLTRLVWWNLAEWVETAYRLESRAASFRKNQQRIVHVRALPLKMVWDERSPETLQSALDLLTQRGSGFCQPLRGRREDAPHTPLICAIKNRMKKLERDLDRDSIPDGHNSLSLRRSMMIGL